MPLVGHQEWIGEFDEKDKAEKDGFCGQIWWDGSNLQAGNEIGNLLERNNHRKVIAQKDWVFWG